MVENNVLTSERVETVPWQHTCSCELCYGMQTEVSKKEVTVLKKYHFTYSDGFIIITDFHLPDKLKLKLKDDQNL